MRYKADILLALSVCVVSFIAFTILSFLVISGKMHGFDNDALLLIKKSSLCFERVPYIREIIQSITSLGGAVVLSFVTSALVVYLLFLKKVMLAIYVSLSVITASIFSNVLKSLFHISRPEILLQEANAHSVSFPSAHTLTGTVAFLTFAMVLTELQVMKPMKAYIFMVAAMVVLLIGISRLYLGFHWPSDVIAGWLGGMGWVSLSWLAKALFTARRINTRQVLV